MNTFERQKDILSIIEKLDISPTLFKNATEKYKTLAKYLNDNGLEADMYPQGSFAIGTVVRPNVKIQMLTMIWILFVRYVVLEMITAQVN